MQASRCCSAGAWSHSDGHGRSSTPRIFKIQGRGQINPMETSALDLFKDKGPRLGYVDSAFHHQEELP
eukprot:538881-Lingulodinium_polyedra.AAC.1